MTGLAGILFLVRGKEVVKRCTGDALWLVIAVAHVLLHFCSEKLHGCCVDRDESIRSLAATDVTGPCESWGHGIPP